MTKRSRAGWSAVADPFTWQTIGVIAGALAVIDGAAPYFTDAGKRIDTEVRALADADVYPRIVVIETEFAPISRNKAATIGEQTILVEGVIPASKRDAEQTAHRLRADLLRALGRITASTFATLPPTVGIVNTFDIGPDCAIKRRVDGLDFTAAQVSVKLTCAVYA